MARIKIEEVLDHLSVEMRKALEDAARNVMPNEQFDSRAFFEPSCAASAGNATPGSEFRTTT
jgi:hypothetical protein